MDIDPLLGEGANHPDNGPAIYAFGQERGVHYCAMQFIDGLTRAHQRGSPADHPDQPTTGHRPPGQDPPRR
jgi:hypothetical protein